jgi:hypothetical protein
MRANICCRVFLACLGSISLGLASPARAVRVSGTYNASGPYSNVMSLTPKVAIFDPGTPNFTGLASLPAPALFGTNTDTIPAFTFGTPLTAVQMTGDAVSSISQPAAGVYDINITLTNFTISSIALAANEYVYLDVWETFTGLPGFSTATWSSGASVTGSACRTSMNDSLFIEPIATVFDSGSSAWIPSSTFFGGTPACGPISASAPVIPLTPYISGGTLSVGFEAILGLNNVDLVAGDTINLPTSLELNLRYSNGGTPPPVPTPLPLAAVAVALRVSRRLRRQRGRAGATAADLPQRI